MAAARPLHRCRVRCVARLSHGMLGGCCALLPLPARRSSSGSCSQECQALSIAPAAAPAAAGNDTIAEARCKGLSGRMRGFKVSEDHDHHHDHEHDDDDHKDRPKPKGKGPKGPKGPDDKHKKDKHHEEDR